ncbi:MAG: CvpA family protein [Planctomycetota bacterium]
MALWTNDEWTQSLGGLPWVDKMGLVLLGLFLVLGAFRGLWWQIVRLIGIVFAVYLARTFTPGLAVHLEGRFDLGEAPALGLTWFCIFVLALVVAALLGRMGKRALDAMHLGPLDRFGGALAGALTGLILHAAVLLLLTGLGTSDWSTETLAGSKSQRLLDAVSQRWPLYVDARVRDELVGPWLRTRSERYPETETPFLPGDSVRD